MPSNFRFNNGGRNGNYIRFGNFTDSIRNLNPCCGCCSLETAAKIVAIIQLMFASMMGIIIGIALIVFVAMKEAHKDDGIPAISTSTATATTTKAPTTDDSKIDGWKDEYGASVIITLLISIFIVDVAFIFLHRYLYKGIQQKNYNKIHNWWLIMLVMTSLAVGMAFFKLIRMTEKETLVDFYESLNLILDVYSLWVIYLYKNELRNPINPTSVEFERVL